MAGIVSTIAVILLALWLVGLVVHARLSAIQWLLVVAVVLIVWNLLSGRRSSV